MAQEAASGPTQQLTDAGTSIWLDDLSRQRISSGELADLMGNRNVVGITTNPTIFSKAIEEGRGYEQTIADLAAQGMDAESAIIELTTADVRDAARILAPVYEASDGQDGRVSIEVSPELAHDTEASIAQALDLHARVGEPGVMIKIPATLEGLPAITAVIAQGISVNVTLIFSVDRYLDVIDAYLEGLERASAAGHDLRTIRSVASFFVSRVDTEVDKRLDEIGTPQALALKGKAGSANARLAYKEFNAVFGGERGEAMRTAGIRTQRPLWASTGVKDPALRDTLYVEELTAPHTVNTMPFATLEAVADHGHIGTDNITPGFEDAQIYFDSLAELGVDFADVTELLEEQGVQKFVDSWHDLLATVGEALTKAREGVREDS